jgi:hypothetical protein
MVISFMSAGEGKSGKLTIVAATAIIPKFTTVRKDFIGLANSRDLFRYSQNMPLKP